MPKRKVQRTSSGKRILCRKTMKPLHLEFNPCMFSELEALTHCWKTRTPFVHPENGSDIQLLNFPFQVCRIDNFFFKHGDFLEDLKDELNSLQYKERNKDLYHYYQSKDLRSTEAFNIQQFREFVYHEFREWLMCVTGFPLTNTMDLTCSRYEKTDYLLCHDDQCDSRKIAFIMYLCRNWQKSDGGALDLFDTDAFGQPGQVVHSFTPAWNSLIFFEVSDVSYHQVFSWSTQLFWIDFYDVCIYVAEVLTEDRSRITIGGWFHVRDQNYNPCKIQPPRYLQAMPALKSELRLADWLNPQYLHPKWQQRINSVLEDKSEVGLIDFLLPAKLQELEVALAKADLPWKFVGPPNQRRYEVLDRVPVPGESAVVWELLQLMQSGLMLKLLFQFSELNLAGIPEDAMDIDSETPAGCHVELQRWTPGCYTALHDMDVSVATLETIFFIGHKQHSTEAGGSIHFLDNNTGTSLATCDPSVNCFTMVYKDQFTNHFTQYLNCQQLTPYYVLRGSYVEQPDHH